MTSAEHAARALDQVRAALPDSTPEQRAQLLEDITRAVYDQVKFKAAGGEGLDGRDGPERRSLAQVVDATINHTHEWRAR